MNSKQPSELDRKADRPLESRIVPAAAIAQFLLMLILGLWNFFDPRLEYYSLTNAIRFKAPSIQLPEPLLSPFPELFSGLAWLAIVFFTISSTAVVWGRGLSRSIRYIGLLMLLVAAWIALCVQWDKIAWQGHRSRAMKTIQSLQPIAESLHASWPKVDGTHPEIGPFMAYPGANAKTLILLTPMQIPDQPTSLAAIDRDNRGRLRFELSRVSDSLWLEWSPEEAPLATTFINGVGAQYELSDSIQVTENWIVSRYQ